MKESSAAEFNNARGAASTLQTPPPFAFSDVKMMVFPLQANLARLNQFCDGYLNLAHDIVQFKPFMPFVYLIILDYGRMAGTAVRTGWVSQREVAFGIPMRWMVPGDDGFEFHDWAFTTPFIFVDNELSLSTGREVYGWPKLLARLDPTIDEWVRDPHGARQVFEIRSKAAADHPGDDLKSPFLSVTQMPLTGMLDIPPNVDSATGALTLLPNAMMGIGRLARDLTATFAEIAVNRMGNATSFRDMIDVDALRRVAGQEGLDLVRNPQTWRQGLGRMLGAMFPKLHANTINLKQFRDAANPSETCYQAITTAKMPLLRFGGGGFLGTQNLLAGQLDGGYRVHITHTAAMPVVTSLGLIPGSSQHVEGGLLNTFAPVCPFWIEVDMVYGTGETLAERGRSGSWNVPDQARTITRIVRKKPAAGQATGTSSDDVPGDGTGVDNFHSVEPSNPFNPMRGASEAVGGTFRFRNAKVRVLPLLADRDVLAKFVKDYVEVSGKMQVRAWGNYVYLMIANYPRITADQQPGAISDSCEVSFVVPVRYYEWPKNSKDVDAEPDPDRMISAGIIAPFKYTDDIIAAIVQNEVFGFPTLRSVITSPAVGWTGDEELQDLRVETRALVVPTLDFNAEGLRRTLLTVKGRPALPDWDEAGWRHIAGPWGDQLRKDLSQKYAERGPRRGAIKNLAEALSRKYADGGPRPGEASKLAKKDRLEFESARCLALRMLGGELGINGLGLKQFRDTRLTDRACYQGIVQVSTMIERLHEIKEIEHDLTVSISRFPTQPIGEILGLIPKQTVATEDGIHDDYEPIRPFEITADLVKGSGQTLFERVGTTEWKEVDKPGGLLRNARNGGDVKALLPMDDLYRMDAGNVSDIEVFLKTAASAEGPAGQMVNKKVLTNALAHISPATVIDAVLNRRWGANRDHEDLVTRADFRVRRNSLGPDIGEIVFPTAESQDGYWPPSSMHTLTVARWHAAQITKLCYEFWRFVEWYPKQDRRSPNLNEIARSTMPKWFIDRGPNENKEIVARLDDRFQNWSIDQKQRVKDGLEEFFAMINPTQSHDDDLAYWQASWMVVLDRLIEESKMGSGLTKLAANAPAEDVENEMEERLAKIGLMP